MLLLRTLAGSKLHGLDTPTSDTDLFEVYSSSLDFSVSGSTEQQTNEGGIDLTRITFNKFVENASAGSHQSLDAMFSAKAEVDIISAYRSNFRSNYASVERLMGTVRELLGKRDAKKNRHALRIAINASELAKTGRYEPTLTAEQVAFVNEIAYQSSNKVFVGVMQVLPLMRFGKRELAGFDAETVSKIRAMER